MNDIIFTTDSPADIPVELQEMYGIGVIPLHVNLEGVDYKDGVDINSSDILAAFDDRKVLPGTSACSIGEYIDFFKVYLDEGQTIIHLAFCSGLSSTYQNACVARAELNAEDRIYIIDTLSLSQAMSIPIYKGLTMRDEGADPEAIVSALQDMIPRLDKSFIITKLDFLVHGGRCSAAKAFGANLLKIKPLIDMIDGKMEVTKKYRGTDLKVYLDYIDDRLRDVDYDDEYLCISKAQIPEETLDAVMKHVKEHYHFQKVVISDAGCVITAHSGKGAFAIFFLKK